MPPTCNMYPPFAAASGHWDMSQLQEVRHMAMVICHLLACPVPRFEQKISTGNAQVFLSREMARLTARLVGEQEQQG
jgi:hypothetical protein